MTVEQHIFTLIGVTPTLTTKGKSGSKKIKDILSVCMALKETETRQWASAALNISVRESERKEIDRSTIVMICHKCFQCVRLLFLCFNLPYNRMMLFCAESRTLVLGHCAAQIVLKALRTSQLQTVSRLS